MKIRWIGHCCFLITSEGGIRILTDPYENQLSLRWDRLDEEAEIITVSHEHFDHNNVGAVSGRPEVLTRAKKVKGIDFRVIETPHGAQMGENRIFCFGVDGVNICHCGDLGSELTDAQIKLMGRIDALMIPVGGTYTIDAEVAIGICERIRPAVVFPMHFRCEKVLSKAFATIDPFLRGKDNVLRLESSEISLKAEDLPAPMQILLLRSQN